MPPAFRLDGRAVALAAALFLTTRADAGMVTLLTPTGGTAGGQPVSATVALTTSTDDVLMTIRNLQPDPKSDIQSVDGISFAPSDGSIFSSSAARRTIAGNGAGRCGTTAAKATDWLCHANVGLGVEITTTGKLCPPETLIGDPYGSNACAIANPSIFDHDPFLPGTATIDLHIDGMTAATMLSSLPFEFGTCSGDDVLGRRSSSVPEPGSIVLCGIAGLSGLGYAWRRRRRAALEPIAGPG